jgi:hypothetical protein
MHQYGRLHVQIVIKCTVCFVFNIVVVEESRQQHVLTEEVHVLDTDRRQLLMSSTSALAFSLVFVLVPVLVLLMHIWPDIKLLVLPFWIPVLSTSKAALTSSVTAKSSSRARSPSLSWHGH